MKIIRFSYFIIITIFAFMLNSYYLGIKPFQFIGVYIGLWILIGFVGLYVGKIYKKSKGIEQEKYSYALPDIMAKIMKKVDMRTQYESSILSMFFIMVGMVAFTVYLVFLAEFTLTFKILTAFNSFFGVVFMLSYLVTTYQQYVSYMETQEVMVNILENSPNGNAEIVPNMLPLPKLELTDEDIAKLDDELRQKPDEELIKDNELIKDDELVNDERRLN